MIKSTRFSSALSHMYSVTVQRSLKGKAALPVVQSNEAVVRISMNQVFLI